MNLSRFQSAQRNHAGRSNCGPTAAMLFALTLAVAATGHAWGETAPNAIQGGHVESVSHHGPVDVTTSVDRSSARIADKITLTLEVRSPAGVQITLPANPEQLGEFDVVDVRDTLDIPIENGRVSTRVYELECLTSGDHTIPAVNVPYADSRRKNTEQAVAQSEPVVVSITSLLEGQTDPGQFRDIKGIVQVTPRPHHKLGPVAIAIGVGALLAGAVLAFVVTRKQHAHLSPEHWALRELESLERQSRTEQLDVQSFYSQLTNIVRIYVEGEFDIAAPRLTTDEFFAHVQEKKALATSDAPPLHEFLATADMVKFAGLIPHTKDVTAAYSKARRFIEESSSNASTQEIE